MVTIIIVLVVVLGIIALGKILSGLVEMLVGAIGIILVAYAAGVVAAVLMNILVHVGILDNVLMSWFTVIERLLAVICG
jgi:hypothetical protein